MVYKTEIKGVKMNMNDIGKTEKKCVSVGCETIFVLDTEILSTLHRLDSMMHGSKDWWNSYQQLCDNCFKQCSGGVNTPDVTIMDKIEKHPKYKKWLMDFGIISIAQLKKMGNACKIAK